MGRSGEIWGDRVVPRSRLVEPHLPISPHISAYLPTSPPQVYLLLENHDNPDDLKTLMVSMELVVGGGL